MNTKDNTKKENVCASYDKKSERPASGTHQASNKTASSKGTEAKSSSRQTTARTTKTATTAKRTAK